MDTKKKKKKISPYMVFSTIVIILLAIAFAFPLYWILTGSFKTQISINSTTPEWWPSEWVMTNYDKLFSRQKSPLWEFAVPFSSRFSADGSDDWHLCVCSPGEVSPYWLLVLLSSGGEVVRTLYQSDTLQPDRINQLIAQLAGMRRFNCTASTVVNLMSVGVTA